MPGESRSRALHELVEGDSVLERLATGFSFAEGPVWSDRHGFLLFSDVTGDTRYRWTAERGVAPVLHPSRMSNGMAVDRDGSLIVCQQLSSRVVRATLNADGTEATCETIASHYEGRELNSPNDVVVGIDGSIYFSDPSYGRMAGFGVERQRELEFCGVYRIPPEGGALEVVVDDFEMPNGLCFSPDRFLLYVNDTPRAHIRVFTVRPDGALENGRTFFEGIGSGVIEEGVVDGMKSDARGNVWVTGPGGIWVLSADGQHLGVVDIPENVANLTWGETDRRTLFIAGWSSLYRLRTRVAGDGVPNGTPSFEAATT